MARPYWVVAAGTIFPAALFFSQVVRGISSHNGGRLQQLTSLEGFGIHVRNMSLADLPKGHPREMETATKLYQLQRPRKTVADWVVLSGSSFEIASTMFPELEGCYSATGGTAGGEATYFVDETAFVWAIAESDDADASYFWIAGYLQDSGDLNIACLATEDASEVHPSDGTWYCESGDDFSVPTSTEFSTSCGCGSDSTPIAPATPAPVASTVTPTVAPSVAPAVGPTVAPDVPSIVAPTTYSSSKGPTGTCSAGESFQISSSVWPEVEGCYVANGYENEGQLIYSISGTAELGYPWLFAYTPDDTDPTRILWGLVLAVEGSISSSQFISYCYSDEPASTHHPADVTSWWCDLAGSGTFLVATSTAFSTDCNCVDATPSPGAPIPTPQPIVPEQTAIEPTETAESTPTPTVSRSIDLTPSPISIGVPTAPTSGTTLSPSGTAEDASEFAEASCGDSGEFLITASQAPEIEGCYVLVDVRSSFDGDWYTTTGTLSYEQTFVFALNDGDATTWFMAFFSNDADPVTYCTSSEDAATVHPTDATWICDLDGDDSFDPVVVGDEDVSVSCGCEDSTPTPTPSRGIEFTPLPISIGIPAPPTVDTTPSSSATVEDAPEFAEASCGESDEFSITASQAPDLEGCYELTDVPSSFDGDWYSTTGTLDYGQTLIYAFNDDGDATNWFVVFFQSDEDSVAYCVSAEDAETVHPTDATWICDLDGDDTLEPLVVGDGEFSADCGCDDASDSITDPSAGAPKYHMSLVVTAAIITVAMMVELAVRW